MDFEALKKQIVQDEGLVLKLYKDTKGIPTIGVGINLLVGITREEATYLMESRIKAIHKELDNFFWFKELNDKRQNVIINMAYNLGVTGLLKFKNMIAAIQDKKWKQAAKEMLDSQWYKDVGKRAERLAEEMERG